MRILPTRYFLLLAVLSTVFFGCKKDGTKPNPPAPVVVRDADGNTYKTVVIGNNTWMAENLKVTHYRNNDPILASSTSLDTAAYCYFNNDPALGAVYGGLYNNLVIHDSRNVCPAGWHLPTEDEWKDLTTALGGDDAAGGKLKETGNTHWFDPNTGATNSSGFNALPAGNDGGGVFVDLHNATYFWSEAKDPYARALDKSHTELMGTSNSYSNQFLSIRCVKDK